MTAPATTTTESEAKSRRALLAGALGGLGAWAAGAVGRASPVRATHGGYLQFGHNHVTAEQTLIENSGSNVTVLRIENDSSAEGVAISARGTDMALEGFSASGYGVVGTSFSGYGVRAEVGSLGKSAVLGRATVSTGILGHSGPEAFPDCPDRAMTCRPLTCSPFLTEIDDRCAYTFRTVAPCRRMTTLP